MTGTTMVSGIMLSRSTVITTSPGSPLTSYGANYPGQPLHCDGALRGLRFGKFVVDQLDSGQRALQLNCVLDADSPW